MSDIVIVRDNGHLVGSDGDHLYDGERVQVGFDELIVTTEIAEDGLSLVRTTALPNGKVCSATRLDREGFDAAALPKVLAGLGENPDERDVSAGLDSAWDAECSLTSHSPVYVDALVDGELVTVEKKLTYIDWTVR